MFWAMLGSLGDDVLFIAGCAALAAGIGGFALPIGKNPFTFRLIRAASVAAFLLMLTAMGLLITAYVQSDFSVASVYSNSHSAKPLFYKVAGAWGNHEGSMILWTLIASLFGAILAMRPVLSEKFTAQALGTQMLMVFAFIAFTLLTSNPFAEIFPVPAEGQGLNPVLQDPALAMHPPILYLGYVGFSLAFSFAVAGLLNGNIGKEWGRALRFYALIAWSALTSGIALGSWWAYYELGWGGWWFWDPVENASFIPWLSGTALIHALIVLEKRGSLKAWAALLALITFTLSLCGTFLVRSGAITSVHAFALDPGRGAFILLLIALTAGSGLLLFALRGGKLEPEGNFTALSRESLLSLNTLFFFAGCATVFIGTVYPMALDLFANIAISVGEPYYRQSFVPLMVPMVVMMGLAPYLKWEKDSFRTLWPRLFMPLMLSAALLFIIFVMFRPAEFRFYLGMGLAAWALCTSVHEWIVRSRTLQKLTLRGHAMTLAHIGFAISLFGMVASSHFSEESLALLKPGGSMKLNSTTLHFQEIERLEGPNYISERATFRVEKDSKLITYMYPERRLYPIGFKVLSDVAIYTTGMSNLYLALGEGQRDNKDRFAGWSVRAAKHPLAPWIWFGCIFMALGGLLALPWKKPTAAR
jgi:cytochrome c-type biogenesis protein CcmF